MVHVTGTAHDVSDNPDRVERIIVRAAEPRMHGTTYITEESAQFPVVDGVLDFEVLPGPCAVAFLRHHGATTYEKLMVPDAAEATFKECLEAGNLVEEGDRSALEKVVRQIQEELAKVDPLVDEVRTLHTEVSNDRTAVDGFAKAAKASASEAASSQSKAKTSETNAAKSAASAETQQKSAWSHFNNTVKEAEKAANSATAAKTSETNAASSASASASSASSSKTQAGKSAASATQAAASRDAAKTSETNAARSAATAKTSETNAAQSASNAYNHRTEAGNHARAAAKDATSAASARDAAKQSQTAAKTSETNANKHRQAAATSESNAAASETSAGESATASASSAAEAKGHADRAEVAADPDGLRDEMTEQFAALVDGAPEDLDTIREIAEYAQANRDVTDQLNAAIGAKANKSHTHAQSEITGLTTALNGKAAKSHTHTTSQVKGLDTALNGKADKTHTHSREDIGATASIEGSAVVSRWSDGKISVPSTPEKNTDATSKFYVDAEVAKKADKSHTHAQSDITGLSTALNGKAAKSHTHDLATLPGRISNEQAPDVTLIGSGVDLNTYETTGVFAQNMDAYAAAGTNYPVDRAGLLEVAQSSSMTYQTYTVYKSGAMYYRGRYKQSWGPWMEVSTKGHTHTTSEVTGLSTALSGKADSKHKHTTADITDFATEMSKKANTSHTHKTSQISGLSTALSKKADKTYVDSRPALFSGSGAPPSSIAGAVAGDFWLDADTMELHKITGV